MKLYARAILLLFLLLPVPAMADAQNTTESFQGRDIILFAPDKLPPSGKRALVIVLHGGLGNAGRIASNESESALNMNKVAEHDDFIVAYLNGTRATRLLGADKEGWNAGGTCCGVPYEDDVDDVAYITDAVNYLIDKYGIDPLRVYGIGHSNGAMMAQRMMCETTVFASVVAVSGPLNLDMQKCTQGAGKRVLGLHGALDENVPVAGGRGTKGISRATYNSEQRAQQIYANSGVQYDLQIVPDADHQLDHIQNVIEQTEHQSIAEKAAKFFGLEKPRRS